LKVLKKPFFVDPVFGHKPKMSHVFLVEFVKKVLKTHSPVYYFPTGSTPGRDGTGQVFFVTGTGRISQIGPDRTGMADSSVFDTLHIDQLLHYSSKCSKYVSDDIYQSFLVLFIRLLHTFFACVSID
jgi:hypothetical protein